MSEYDEIMGTLKQLCERSSLVATDLPEKALHFSVPNGLYIRWQRTTRELLRVRCEAESRGRYQRITPVLSLRSSR